MQNRSMLGKSAKHDSQAVSLVSKIEGSQLWMDHSNNRRRQRKPDEHYWDITSLLPKDSSRTSELSALGDEFALQRNPRRRKNEHYWESTNVEPSPTLRESDRTKSSHQLLDKRQQRYKKERYWEGYNEELLAHPQQPQHTSPSHKRRHEKPYWN